MSSGFLLDTHVLVWIVNGQPLRPEALDMIADAARNEKLNVSAATAWEIGLLGRAGRSRGLDFGGDPLVWFEQAIRQTRARILDIDYRTALGVSQLPEPLHRDPGDRMLITTARQNDLTMVTRDQAILNYAEAGHVRATIC